MDRVNKLLPKVLETAEKELGYSLPKVKIVNTRAYVQNNYYELIVLLPLIGVGVGIQFTQVDCVIY